MEDIVERKKPKRTIVLYIVIIIVLFSVIGIISLLPSDEVITAKEANDIATPYAEEWNESAVLVAMGVTDFSADPATYVIPEGKNGKFSQWFCTYVVQTNIGENSSAIGFNVSSNGTVIEYFRSNVSEGLVVYEDKVSNWTIDSDEAYQIAISNEEVTTWLQEHPNSKGMLFGLGSYTERWNINWRDPTEGNEGFLSADVNYSTGDILVRSSKY